MTKQLSKVGEIYESGFTLLELLVVMVIIGLLAAYVGPRYFAQIGKSERSTAKAQIESSAKRWTPIASTPATTPLQSKV